MSKSQTVGCKNKYRTNRLIMVDALTVSHDYSGISTHFSGPPKTRPRILDFWGLTG